ncbi:MAG: (Fe-S)-binding protein [Candidatus Cloacimonadota bacterium]|nr:MAG: (Fe-S)-binding protein [Candidatus Cloacimonadota bacterium]
MKKSTAKKSNIDDIIKKTNSFLCIDCGECTGSCPVSRVNIKYSPRLIVEKVLLGYFDEIKKDEDLWSCLVCGLCSNRCPSDVKYDDFIRMTRKEIRKHKEQLNYTHNRIIQKSMEIMALGHPLNRLDWITKDLKVASKGKYLYFTGCLPYFDVIFEHLNIKPTDSAKNAIKIMNKLGIKPVVSNKEVCCGRDLLYNGDEENFLKLAKINKQMIKDSGTEKIVCTCPECLECLKEIYTDYVGKLNVEFIHITQLMNEGLKKGKLKLNPLDIKKVTFQDPCILGRGFGIYDEPRNVIKSIPEIELLAMEREKDDSICCGPSAWVNCTNYTKRIQHVRLEQAEKTGAQFLITACPKCMIHFSCALNADDSQKCIKLKDISTLISESMKGKNGKRK